MLNFRMLTGRLKYLLILIALVLLVGTCILVFSFPAEHTENNEVNVCLHLSDYDNETISYLKDLRVSWVRTDWIMTSDSSMRDYAQKLQDNNINLLAIIDANTFSNQNFTLKQWNTTVTEIVTSDGFNNTDAVEIWNEPNGGSYVQPNKYYEMLKSAYTIIKNYTTVQVVFAGISPNIPQWQNYLTTVFANNDTQDYFDYMGIHFYDDVTTNLGTLQFVEGLTNKLIWLTETGKPSERIDETAQVEYLSSIYSNFKPLVDKIFIYELKDNYGLFPETENHFGLLAINGVKKESYDIVWDISRK